MRIIAAIVVGLILVGAAILGLSALRGSGGPSQVERVVSALSKANMNADAAQIEQALKNEGMSDSDAKATAEKIVAYHNATGKTYGQISEDLKKVKGNDLKAVVAALAPPSSSVTAAATGTATPAATATTAATANDGKCTTNSPNIPCITAQAKTAGFTPFRVGDQVIGGPAEQWWPLMRADGSYVPTSFHMVGMRQTDKGLPGYEMFVPSKMIMHVWVDNPALPNSKSAFWVYGPANIQASSRAAEATLFTVTGDFVDGLAGKWALFNEGSQCGSEFVSVGTIPARTAPHDCHTAK